MSMYVRCIPSAKRSKASSHPSALRNLGPKLHTQSLKKPSRVNECNREWVLKNSFQGISITKFVRKLLNVRSPQTLEFAEILLWFLFQHPRDLSPVNDQDRAAKR